MDQHEGNFYRIMKMGTRLARTCNGLEIKGWNVLGPDLPAKYDYPKRAEETAHVCWAAPPNTDEGKNDIGIA
jgi:hypothetical protein